MLVFANAAMLWFGRRPAPRGGNHIAAMYTGGNIGMVLGMIVGGFSAARVETGTISLGVGCSFVGMTTGMLAGMLAGTWIVEKVLDLASSLRVLPRWLRAGELTRSAE
jgi:hypothetical protein